MLNLNINQETFSEVLKKAQKSVASKAAMDVLKDVKLSAMDDVLYIDTTDGDIYVRQHVAAGDDLEIIEDGSICVPVKQLSQTVRLMTSDVISLQLQESTLLVKGQKQGKKNKSTMRINGQNASQFPKPQKDGKDKSHMIAELQGDQLKQMIGKTVFATSKMETRPVLTGVLFSKRDQRMNVIATDSHRFSQYNVDLDDFRNDDAEYNSVIPSGALSKIASYIKEDDHVNMYQSENETSISLYSDDVFIQSRLLTGNYPDTDRLIPRETKIAVKLDKEEFKLALQRASVMSESKNNVVTFTLNDDDNTVTLNANDESGQSTEVFEAEEREGEGIELSFSIEYMLDALKQLDDSDVELNINSKMKPIVIRERNHTQLVLPVRVY